MRTRLLLCIWMAMLLLTTAGGWAAPKKKALATPRPTPPKAPAEALKFKPWGTLRAYQIVSVDAAPPQVQASGRTANAATDPARFRSMLERATVFEHATGWRIVPAGGAAKAASIEYIEVKRNGSGFSVGTTQESDTHLYLSRAKFPSAKDHATTDAVTLDADAEINYTGGKAQQKQAARLKIAATFVEEYSKPREEARPAALPKPKAADDDGGDKGKKPRGKRGAVEPK